MCPVNLPDSSSDEDDFEEVCDLSIVINIDDNMAVKEQTSEMKNTPISPMKDKSEFLDANNNETEDKNSYRSRAKTTVQKVEKFA